MNKRSNAADTVTAFGALLNGSRKAMGKSLDEMAAALGMSKTHLWGLEHGRHAPSLIVAGRLAKAYHLTIMKLYDALMQDEAHYARKS